MAPVQEPAAERELPPAQYLMLETLAARYRLGEPRWTFPRSHTRFARALADKGLAWWESGIVEDTIEVTLTDAGRERALNPEYAPPDSLAADSELALAADRARHLAAFVAADPSLYRAHQQRGYACTCGADINEMATHLARVVSAAVAASTP